PSSDPSSADLAQGGKEALVLRARPVGDPQVSWTTEGCARADGDAGPGQGLDGLPLVDVTEIDPGEVGLGLGRHESHPSQLLLDEEALDQVLLHAVGDIILVADRLGPGRLGDGVDAEGLAYGVHRGAELRRTERVTDSKPC